MSQQPIQIDASHFIGQGAQAWLIVGRVPGDDDDTAKLVLADDEGSARETFRAQLFEESDVGEGEQARLERTYGESLIVTDAQRLN